jgi:hypothetical protein
LAETLDIFYGIGAAKSGTSWLQDYYASHPECHVRGLKEIHFFGRTPGQGDPQSRQFRKHLARTLRGYAAAGPAARSDGRPDGATDARAAAIARQAREYLEWFEYLDRPDTNEADYIAFLTLRLDLAPEARICADITPRYALLGEADFEQMARIARQPRFVFVMRDPVDRVWSHCRMMSKIAEKWHQRQVTPETYAEAFLNGEAAEGGVEGYCDYAGTLTRLVSVVGREAVFTGFYEDLTADATLRALNAFLGLTHREAEADRRVNSGRSAPLPEDLKAALGRKLAPQYDYVAGLSGGALPPAWQENARAAA